ncbi:MAG: cyclic nucleotide-binding domain-containing protein [Proteobacteria bacterium]|nr:cyclic nucleotide-binding domain-containing protein [Pseudomonadota bacterium]MBU4297531.1 cyclic nucleotide-binding domain-containing protein [Pseudomonadota bacterium]MCG2749749.1 cyclic nucleotide-binding domain-containing protein [Desulfobulbaceae bacterium]
MQAAQEKTSESQTAQRQFHNVFPEFMENEVEKLICYLELRRYAQGAIVWQQSDPLEFMGLLVEGKLVIKREGRFPGKNIILAILEKGSLFGEMAVAASHPHSVTISAVEETQAYVLSFDNAQNLFQKEPALSIKLLKKIIVVCGLRLQHTGSRLAELL